MQTVNIIEVGPRDGLQNEKTFIQTDQKIEFIERLSETGLQCIEAVSFVSPKWIPQMENADVVIQGLSKKPRVDYPVFVPNEAGYAKAKSAGTTFFSVFTAASETFCQKNVNASQSETFERAKTITALAQRDGFKLRAYVSCIFECPYVGSITPDEVLRCVEYYSELGITEIVLGDTIGTGTYRQVVTLLERLETVVPVEHLGVHFHDTYGQALAHYGLAYDLGIRRFDSSIAGLGGCPYARGAAGNVATEEVVYYFEGRGIDTGVDLDKLYPIIRWTQDTLALPVRSKLGKAVLAQGKE